MRIVIVTIGSEGAIRPCRALALELKRWRHEVAIATGLYCKEPGNIRLLPQSKKARFLYGDSSARTHEFSEKICAENGAGQAGKYILKYLNGVYGPQAAQPPALTIHH